ncbi:MAG: OmpA family protein [Leptolyngbyaceae cyanobacterium SU_3_3]|nr:OmpA family protein [Leptolyngbyaceae cyanobacterium SU_3_3]
MQSIASPTPPNIQPPASSTPSCVTPPVAQAPPPTPTTPEPNIPIRITVPKNVHFALDKSNLSPESTRVLDRIAEVVLANPTIVLELQGHTDPRASDAYNQKLGERRSLSVRNYLIRKGISPARMTIRSLANDNAAQTERHGSILPAIAASKSSTKMREISKSLSQEEDLQLEPGRGR